MASITIPDQPDVIEAPLQVSTGKGDDKKEKQFTEKLPRDLGSAVKFEAEENRCSLEAAATIVFKMYINAKVIALQNVERQRLAPEGEKKDRKRAPYMEALGL